ncbi:uncharacterized protein LOC124696962 [Lolium rigidum]|uniref:uncharacterized protein LOC124696962 n=1 Tax=Lolium rigidum TaxID=89674 RepID=UPI001F5C0E9A|nr:uncharacterized protein LOC124696962 [Lolium rigidum]
MPSLLKDRATGRLGRLISALRPARAGPLPVQTGFPTSLADLFVKNHGRLRKPSSCASAGSRRKKRGAAPSPSPPPSPAPSPPASSPPTPPPPLVAVSPPTQPRPELPPAAEPVCDAGREGSVFGLGLGFLALVGVVMSLAVLVIWSRTVVAAAVTVAAFSLFLLEPIRSFSLRRKPRPPATREAPDLDGRGYVSPIREVEAETELPTRSCSDSDRWTDVASILSTEDRIEEMREAGGDSGSSRGKAKRRSWRKLIPRRLQKGRIRKEDADSSLSSSFRSESSEADAAVGGSATRATDRPDSRRGSGRHQADATVGGNARAMDRSDSRRGSGRHQAYSLADAAGISSDPSGPRRGTGAGMDAEVRSDAGVPIGVDADNAVSVADGPGGRRLPLVAAVVVVLVGLVAGRLPAVAFTVLFVSSLQRLPCRREGR